MEARDDERFSAQNPQNNDELSRYSTSNNKTGLRRRLTNCWRREWTFFRSEWTWFLPAFIVFYSFIKEIKVGEPFLFKYQTEYLNLTRDQLKGEIYIWMPYSYLIALVPIFLLTDLFLYKPTMLVEILGQIGFRSALVFGQFGSVFPQILGNISYGVASASEVAFFSYIYAKLEKAQYQKLTSWTRAGTMGGRSLGYLASQIIILTQIGNYRTLNVIAFIFPCVVLIFCILMPKVHWKSLVARMAEAKAARIMMHSKNPKKEIKLPKTYGQYLRKRVKTLHSDFLKIYSSSVIVKWSVWWSLTNCMSLQFALLSQTLWGEVQTPDSKAIPMNGFCEAAYTFVAALSILGMNSFTINWAKWGETALVLISSIDAIVLVIYARAENIYVMYVCYVIYRSLFQVMITIAQFNIAKAMVCESFGIVFGCNTLISLILQSLLTLLVTDKNGPFNMGIREQYVLYSIFHMIIAVIFLFAVFFSIAQYFIRRPKIADKSQIYMSHASLRPDDEEFKKEAIRDAIDIVEEDSEPISSVATSDTENGNKSDSDSNA